MTGTRTAARAPDARQTMTDADVRQARALVELAGWTTHQVIERFAHVKRTTVECILKYQTRGSLMPKPSDLPEGVKAL